MSRHWMPRVQPVPEGLEHRFFGGETAGIMLRRGLASGAVFDFVRRIDTGQKQLAMPLDHLGDPQAFDDVGANAEDGHGRGLVAMPVRGAVSKGWGQEARG